MAFITRARWGAREDGLRVYTTTWAQRVGFTVHYSAGPPTQTVRTIQDYHISKGWGDIGYNFLVDTKGNIYEGRKYTWLAVGAHSAGENTAYLGVCFIGRDSDVTDAAKNSIRQLYYEANRLKGSALRKAYHSGMPGAKTECPGDKLRNWVKAGMTHIGDDDMTPTEVRNQVALGFYDVLHAVYTGKAYGGITDSDWAQEMKAKWQSVIAGAVEAKFSEILAKIQAGDPVAYETVRKAIRDQADDNPET